MEKIVALDSVAQYNQMRGVPTLHPLLTILDLSKANPMPAQSFYFGLYAVYLKEVDCGEIKYGRAHYDYQEGTLLFIAPGQVVTVQRKETSFEPKGWALLFHPDLIKGTALGKLIHDYSFFSYDVKEALHISDRERKIVLDCFGKIEYELNQSIDRHSKKLIAANIELFLNYCTRFYDRQFLTRATEHSGLMEQFETLLHQYFSSAQLGNEGLPSVAFCARKLHLSPNYFGDLVKKETGISAQEFIHTRIIDLAKEKIFDLNKSVSAIAYELGFKYPQHFTRLFKQKVGISPNEYRHMN